MTRFTRAIVRGVADSFASGLSAAQLGAPVLELARAQHARYCAALTALGLELTVLEPDESLPDSTFVEDTAILTPRSAILTRPGAPSRQAEVVGMRAALKQFFQHIEALAAPATVDGGDVCEAGNHFFIGLSARTNEEGTRTLARLLGHHGYTSTCVDIRKVPGILHLKSGLAYLGEDELLVIPALADHPALRKHRLLRTEPGEEYAANCVLVNGHLLVPAGFPRLQAELERAGHATLALEMSEFQKQDGGLSCLSLRF